MALTPICFANVIELYRQGFSNIIDRLTEEQEAQFYELRDAEVLSLMELQFVLTYRAHLTKEDVDNMNIFELKNWYALLKKQLKLDSQTEQGT